MKLVFDDIQYHYDKNFGRRKQIEEKIDEKCPQRTQTEIGDHEDHDGSLKFFKSTFKAVSDFLSAVMSHTYGQQTKELLILLY